LGNTLELVILLMMGMTGTHGDPEKAFSLLSGLQSNLQEDVRALEREAQEASTPVGKGCDIALLQAEIALEKGDSHGLIGALNTALGLVETSPELIGEDLEEIEQFAQLLQKTCQPNDETSQSLTSVLMAG
jgi:hypothetical protein